MTKNTTTKRAVRRAGVLTTAVAAALLGVWVGAAPMANAADDCGLGYHLVGDTCIAQPWLAQDVMNVPGPGPLAPGCWIDPLGVEHCHPVF